MPELNELLQTADWKSEKHVPVIDVPDILVKGEFTNVTASIGKAVSHPNTTQHHIAWISLFFLPDGEKYPYELGKFNFSSHGSSINGADTSTVYTHHAGTLAFKTDKPGTLMAQSYCNIHGLWQNSKSIKVE
ncbi:MAG: Neelaredoxin [Candidatus Margulisiibacteriota bacterium]|nr:MAG: Neelaredoxin [Candidatus Margulisbacteria bacterium GWD2_39_127]OGI03563.1 MAG: Neelaredoxin [Candidatus Margulisbacteria bacterium GWF2_38_17]OGI11068.1 MAG: Neelaredoxin [Candidatus Margulisbacteria bacterium GWE2_39_32]PZM80178.1 MAG: Neelaredoxin [Candidatus Margulisiibacteriota bacterium]HAR62338.1 Neelaredoxin [Candidatus Margulisiibacteriota bacterium]